MNVDSWRSSDYFDQQLPDLIEFGFPLDFDTTRVLGVIEDNHPSAKKFADDIDAYIEKNFHSVP